VLVDVTVGVLVDVMVGVLVGVTVAVLVGVTVAVLVGVTVAVFVGVLVCVAVFVGVLVGVDVGVAVVPVYGSVDVGVGVVVEVFVGVCVGVAVGVGVGKGPTCTVIESAVGPEPQVQVYEPVFIPKVAKLLLVKVAIVGPISFPETYDSSRYKVAVLGVQHSPTPKLRPLPDLLNEFVKLPAPIS
jgi:hypothetical protein